MMRAVTIIAALGVGYYLYTQNGLPQVASKAPSGKFSEYTGAAKLAISPLTGK